MRDSQIIQESKAFIIFCCWLKCHPCSVIFSKPLVSGPVQSESGLPKVRDIVKFQVTFQVLHCVFDLIKK